MTTSSDLDYLRTVAPSFLLSVFPAPHPSAMRPAPTLTPHSLPHPQPSPRTTPDPSAPLTSFVSTAPPPDNAPWTAFWWHEGSLVPVDLTLAPPAPSDPTQPVLQVRFSPALSEMPDTLPAPLRPYLSLDPTADTPTYTGIGTLDPTDTASFLFAVPAPYVNTVKSLALLLNEGISYESPAFLDVLYALRDNVVSYLRSFYDLSSYTLASLIPLLVSLLKQYRFLEVLALTDDLTPYARVSSWSDMPLSFTVDPVPDEFPAEFFNVMLESSLLEPLHVIVQQSLSNHHHNRVSALDAVFAEQFVTHQLSQIRSVFKRIYSESNLVTFHTPASQLGIFQPSESALKGIPRETHSSIPDEVRENLSERLDMSTADQESPVESILITARTGGGRADRLLRLLVSSGIDKAIIDAQLLLEKKKSSRDPKEQQD